METLTIRMRDRDEEASIWPEASPEERLNSTATMILLDNVVDANDIFHIFFTIDNAASTITFRTAIRPEVLRRLRQILSGVPELDVVLATV